MTELYRIHLWISEYLSINFNEGRSSYLYFGKWNTILYGPFKSTLYEQLSVGGTEIYLKYSSIYYCLSTIIHTPSPFFNDSLTATNADMKLWVSDGRSEVLNCLYRKLSIIVLLLNQDKLEYCKRDRSKRQKM